MMMAAFRGCGVCVLSYLVLSRFLTLANLTSTTKFKKYGDELKMSREKWRLEIGGDDKASDKE